MPTLTLTVARIDPPPAGRPSGNIIGTNSEIIGAYPDKLSQFVVGHAYEIEYTEKPWNNKMFKNLKSFTEVEAAKTPAATLPSQGGGSAPQNGYYRPTDPADAKRIFVCANLTAMINAGKVENTKESVWATTQLFCQVYDHTFGSSTFLASEAGERAA